jgi:AraC-like DNA-binding protein
MEWDHEFDAPPLANGPVDHALPVVARQAFSEHNEVADADFGQFRDVLNSHFYPAKVEPLAGAGPLLNPVLSALHLPHSTIAYVRFGTAARVDPGDLSTYHVNVPLRGQVQSACADQFLTASPREAAVFSPEGHTRLARWESDASQLCIKLDRAAVEVELAGLLGHAVTRPIRFDLRFPLYQDGGRNWTSLLTALLLHIQMPSVADKPNPVVTQLERSMLTGLLVTQRHSYSEELFGHTPASTNRDVKRVVDLIESQPETPYSVGDLARVAGVSSRSLQTAFQRDLGVSPMAYLRQVRLERTREDLLLGRGPVSEVAYHWGFTNLGRFATQYRSRFGELPSETIARSQ